MCATILTQPRLIFIESCVVFPLLCCSYFHVFHLLCIDSYSNCCNFYRNQFFNHFTCQLPSHTIPKVAQLLSFSQWETTSGPSQNKLCWRTNSNVQNFIFCWYGFFNDFTNLFLFSVFLSVQPFLFLVPFLLSFPINFHPHLSLDVLWVFFSSSHSVVTDLPFFHDSGFSSISLWFYQITIF